jgi:hypothetical protein
MLYITEAENGTDKCLPHFRSPTPFFLFLCSSIVYLLEGVAAAAAAGAAAAAAGAAAEGETNFFSPLSQSKSI